MTEQKLRVSKEFSFEAAHALDGYNGKCKDIHGHSYHLIITVLGFPKLDMNLSECGMVIDFADIKSIAKKSILPLFDHRLLLRNDSRFKGLEKENDRIRYVSYQPTCENMLLEIVEILNEEFPNDIELHSVKLRETGTSFCEWHSSDNSGSLSKTGPNGTEN